MDRLTALTVFRQAAELGSFAEAARKLGLSPAAVSKNIGELEAYLGNRLFHRTTRRMSLTDAGVLYYDRVSPLLDDLKDADSIIGDMQDTPSGVLRVSAPVSVTLMSLSSALPGFLRRYPDLTLDLQLDDRRVNLIDGGFDLAIRGSDNLEDSSLVARKLMTLQHVLCGAPAYFDRFGLPRIPSELKDHCCVQFSLSGHSNKWDFKKGAQKVTVPIDGPYKVSSSLAVRDALLEGFGLSLIPLIYVRKDIEEGRLRTALDDWSPNQTQIYAVYPSRRHLSSKVRVFIDFLLEEFKGRQQY